MAKITGVTPDFSTVIHTPRLQLRPVDIADAERFAEIQSNWNVLRMLRMASAQPTTEGLTVWLSGHYRAWSRGEAHRFAVIESGRVIGCADVDEIDGDSGELGYWLDQAAWGRGLATEAAAAVRDFAFATLGLARLETGCAVDNFASARVLQKLGFEYQGDTRLWSKPRAAMITQRRYRLNRP